VLLVDDAVVVRKALSLAIDQDPDLEVAGTAVNGRVGLAKFISLKPDIVLLDVEMPEMNGIETVRELRKIDRRVPIIMFSSLTEQGAAVTLEALSLGASDYVTKPSNIDMTATLEAISRELIPKVRVLCRLPETRSILTPEVKAPVRVPALPLPPRSRLLSPVHVVAIGVSTGGPDALAHVLPALPKDFPVPVVIVQHMPPLFTRMLAERLNKQAKIIVHEGEPGMKLEPGHACIAPGDYHMIVEKRGTALQLAMNQGPPENSCRPAVDVLFRSVASVFGASTLAVVLTGMGSDGVLGSQVVRERGGRVYVQDEASSVVWGMPGQVAAAGWADSIFPLRAIAGEIDRHVRESRQLLKPARGFAPINTS